MIFVLLALLLPDFAQAAARQAAGAGADGRPRQGSECLTPEDERRARGPVTCSQGSNRQRFPVSQVSMARARELFEKAARLPGISYGFVDDGCYARAHAIARKLEEEGVLVGKIFTTGELAALRPIAGPALRQKDGTEVPDRYVRWNYHVAPFVMVDTGGRREIHVLDPSLFQGPVKVQEWMQAQLATADSYLRETQTADRHAFVLGNQESWRLTTGAQPARLFNGVLTTPQSARPGRFRETDIDHTETTNRNYFCTSNPGACPKAPRGNR